MKTENTCSTCRFFWFKSSQDKDNLGVCSVDSNQANAKVEKSHSCRKHKKKTL